MKTRFKTMLAGLLLFAPAILAANPPAPGPLTMRTVVRQEDNTPAYAWFGMVTSVVDSKGAAVEGLGPADFQFNTIAVPPGAGCGLEIVMFEERKPGLYYTVVEQMNRPNCHWVVGDYLQRLLISLPNKASGEIPVRFHHY